MWHAKYMFTEYLEHEKRHNCIRRTIHVTYASEWRCDCYNLTIILFLFVVTASIFCVLVCLFECACFVFHAIPWPFVVKYINFTLDQKSSKTVSLHHEKWYQTSDSTNDHPTLLFLSLPTRAHTVGVCVCVFFFVGILVCILHEFLFLCNVLPYNKSDFFFFHSRL